MYPEFEHELEIESGTKVDLRGQGTIVLASRPDLPIPALLGSKVAELEPSLETGGYSAFYLHEKSVDPRALTAAAWQTANNRGGGFSSGDALTSVNLSDYPVPGGTPVQAALFAAQAANC